jgi:predicted lipoprotein with Yx(FWY)xxD motif
MIYSDKIRDVTLRPDERGRCFTGMEILAIAGAVSTVASAGMSIIGASQQADAQREAGEVAYQQALIRNQQAQAEAKRLEDKANAEQAAAQRQAIEEKRKATILASRAQAVMASSGAGVDTNILDGILAEGEYGFDTALYEGDTRAQSARYDASLRRWEGETGVTQGAYTKAVRNSQADSTLTSGIIKGGLQLGSLALKYGGEAPGGDYVSVSQTTARRKWEESLARSDI